MATKLTLAQVMTQFPGAWEAETQDLDPEEVQDLLSSLTEGEGEYWTHLGVLYSRTWWTAYGWHYGEFSPEHGWFCPDAGETVCPWTGEEE